MAWDTGAKIPKVGKLHFPSIINIVSKYLSDVARANEDNTGNGSLGFKNKAIDHVSGSTKTCQSE